MRVMFGCLMLASLLCGQSEVHAQVSLLRVFCDDANKGAEVSADGKFKGECPVDVGVPAGTVKLRVVKKVDATHERVFEQEFRLGDGVVKRVDAVFSVPQISAEGLAQENRRALLERAAVSKRALVREVDLATGRIPPRPQVPLEINEDIWMAIEGSEAYRNQPKSRVVKVAYRSSIQFEYTGSDFASVPRQAPQQRDSTSESAPLGDRCSTTLANRTDNGIRDKGRKSFQCGLISLGSTFDGKTEAVIKSLDELKGSLFPMRIGNRLSIRYQMTYQADRGFDSSMASTCDVVSQGPAREVDARLTGTAWRVHCQGSFTFNRDGKVQSNDSTTYYFEDLGAWLSDIGSYDISKKAFFLPTPGSTIVFNQPDPKSGMNMITTYASFDWSVDK